MVTEPTRSTLTGGGKAYLKLVGGGGETYLKLGGRGGKTYLKLGGGDDNRFECWRFESMIEG